MENLKFGGAPPRISRRIVWIARQAFLFLGLALSGKLAQAQGVNVLTRNYNSQRTGANVSETSLKVSNVNSSQFGKLFMLPVDDQVYAGVLYVSALSIGGGTRNVIYVATSNNSVYAFDADTFGPPLWFINFNAGGRPSTNADVGQYCGSYTDFLGNIGIVGTPVIDGSAKTMYFVTRTVEGGSPVQRLHAIDIATGNERPGSPQVVQATVPGNRDGGTTVAFSAQTENQRPALALSQGVVYVAWASYCDTGPYHGWVLAYDGNSLVQLAAYNVTPNGDAGGIWMAGAGPIFDSNGNIFYSLGNGSFDGATDYGESMLKLAGNSLTVADYFTPSDYNTLNAADLDFGSSGPSMLPGTTLFVNGGKEGRLYLLDTASLGQLANGDVQIPQVFQAVDLTVRPSATHHIHNASPIWNSPQGVNVYVWGENDFLHAYRFSSSSRKLNTSAAATGSVLPPQGMPGGMMTISASGSQSGTGIVWATAPRIGDANHFTVPGNLYAFNAENLALLWSSTGTGDDLLNFSKGSAPIVANGKVYVGSTSKFVTVYGLKTAGPVSQDLALNQTATGSTPCNANEPPSKAVNGSFSGGLDDKWCSSAANPFLTVDLGTSRTVSRFVVEHAGAGGESLNLNTVAFNIQVSSDGANFNTVVTVANNQDSITTHDIAPTSARYVRLNITDPSQADSNARIYEFQVFGSQVGAPADFSVSGTPGSQTVTAGGTGNYSASVAALNGFNGTVTWSASGVPAGATASFSPATVNGAGSSALAISTSSSTPAGSYTVTITGKSGSLQHSASVTLVVNAVNLSGGAVDLSSVYNVSGIMTDGSLFTTGLDGDGFAYSANLMGGTVSFNGAAFKLGPANAPDAVSSTTIPLPGGQYSALAMLATGVDGNQGSQTFVVRYADGSSSSFQQSLSDWYTPQSYAGEGTAVMMAYRNVNDGSMDNRPFYLYGYSFPLNSSKTLSSITLPNNGNVIVLAMTLGASIAPPPDFTVSAAPSSQTVTAGAAGSYTASVAPQNGFNGTVTWSASGTPTGATVGFSPATLNGAGSSTVNVSTSSSTPAGTYTVTFTGTSGSLQHSTAVALVVNAPASSGGGPVNLASAYNVSGIVTDGSTFGTGLDQGGFAYSANLLGSTVNFNGSTFKLGPANAPDAVTGTTIALPAGQYSSLAMLATALNGNQGSQTFAVKYTDGSSSSIQQSLSDWYTPQSYPGEGNAVSMAYRDVNNGTRDQRSFYLYGYSLQLDSSKTASSITLPNNANVLVLAMTLNGAAASPDFTVSASPASQTVTSGGTGNYAATVNPQNGFNGTVSWAASGVPTGATASFSGATASGASAIISSSASTPAGTYTLKFTGSWGTLQHQTSVTLVVNPAASGPSVNLGSSYNVSGIVTDGSVFTTGLDQGGFAYSSNLLGSTVNFNGSTFALGPANAPDAVTSTSIPLPAGNYSALAMLATGVNGNQGPQNFVVRYSDGSSSTIQQGLSDWYTPQGYAGEGAAVITSYRDANNGTKDLRSFFVYGYSLPLNSSKTVSSITLPNNPNVVVLALTLVP
jgi:hypothetical protein